MMFSLSLSAAIASMLMNSPDIKIIPRPVSLRETHGSYIVGEGVRIITTRETRDVADMLSGWVRGHIDQVGTVPEQIDDAIVLALDSSLEPKVGKEGYALSIVGNGIRIVGARPAGVFYGIQSLRQMLPPEIEKGHGLPAKLPAVEIEDKPRFKWRGMMIDSCRHFVSKEFVLKFIDLLALHKMNTLHWHLSEDQGWRIEIKKYPKLTELGSMRKATQIGKDPNKFDGIPHGGFYSQQDIKEVVAYARQRYINVVPEIEMPGHSLAALTAYPEFSCTGGPFEVGMKWGVYPDVYCPGKEGTYKFLQDILSEVMELFPSRFIHVGGDEVPKDRWKKCPDCQKRIKDEKLKNETELQSYFTRRMEKWLSAHGRRLVGWDEILEGGLPAGAVVMSWRSESGGIEAAKAGHDVIMAPNDYTYFDHYQSPNREKEPLAIGGLTTLEQAYSYEPVPAALSPADAKHVLGSQAQLWSEYFPNEKHVEYMAFPRLCALSECVWSPKEGKDFRWFSRRLEAVLPRLDTIGVNYRKPN